MIVRGSSVNCANPLNKSCWLNRGLISEYGYIPGLSNESQKGAGLSNNCSIVHDLAKLPCGSGREGTDPSTGNSWGRHGVIAGGGGKFTGPNRPGGLGKTWFNSATVAGWMLAGNFNAANVVQYQFSKTAKFAGFAWIRLTTVGTKQTIMNCEWDNSISPLPGWGLSADTKLYFQMVNEIASSGRSVNTAGTVFAINKWYHVGFSYDGSNTAAGITLYINGVKQTGLTTAMDTDPGTLAGIRAQAWHGNSTANLSGYGDQVRIYGREVFPYEARELYKEVANSGPNLYNWIRTWFAEDTVPPLPTGTGTIAATHSGASLAGTGSFVFPNYTGTGVFAPAGATFAGLASSKTITATAALTSHNGGFVGAATFSEHLYTGVGILISPIHLFHGVVVPNFTGNAIITTGHHSATASAHPTVPTYHGTGVVSSHATIASTARFLPTRTASAALSGHATISIVGVFTQPTYHGTGTGSSHAIIVGAATSAKPLYSGTGVLTTHARFVGVTVSSQPVYHGTGTLVSRATEAGTATFTVPTYHGLSVLSSRGTLVGVGTFAKPIYSGTAALISHTVFASSAIFLPHRTGTAAVSGHATVSGLGTFRQPTFAAAGLLNSRASGGGTATYLSPARVAVGVFTAPRAAASAIGKSWPSQSHATSALTVPPRTFAGLGTVTQPRYSGVATLLSHKSLAASATFTTVIPTGHAAVTVHATETASGTFKATTTALGVLTVSGFTIEIVALAIDTSPIAPHERLILVGSPSRLVVELEPK